MDYKELDYAFPVNQLQEMKMAFENGDFLQAAQNIKKSLVGLEHIPLNIAVTGESGSGKSTFINVIRGLGDEDEGSAKTGVVETTVVATRYSHPRLRNVIYWDLPGIGTAHFTPNEYLKLVKFDEFDFFFIIASHRFRDCHIQLAQAINSMGKKFYFVRSKIDADLNACRRLRKSSYNEDQILMEIRSNCIKGLHDGGIMCPRVFLLSCLELEKYDFYLMQKTLENELPSHKRHVFLLTLPNIYFQALESKRDVFRNQIWKHALASAAKALLPIPGLSVDNDIDLLVNTIGEYKEAFGLDQRSLNCLATTFDKDVHDLRSVIRSQLVLKEITYHEVVNFMHRRELTKAALMVTDYAAGAVPLVGSVAAGGVAFGTAYWLLYSLLKDIADDAKRVLSRALENTV
ncbi:PREDICTED: interferon-inducible GTPase 5-like [Nanorana parkeri]|uniref:interferon-inducible GTPase 5-like n=1 Tax=Nanorana parkeri TaxID=125878 RepID=UPI000854120C|nr:PREDICTED: interferon-inducible GTPase 5-like [Nanorana parkeri]